ncbi:MAG TPA: SUMF1/EgtB/PvdO family nonheme iron enzyme [Nitrospira sp.]|nr:SUMF1/EgtB/PvdO family nonheme iron enzyme [Nitrospira sp.]
MPCAVIAAALLAFLLTSARDAEGANGAKPSPPLARHLAAIAGRAQPAPLVTIPAGDFTIGSKRIDDDPYGLWTQFDDTELPQQRVRLHEFAIDRDEVSLGEYLAYLARERRHPADELQKLLWHVITVHSVSDETLARWPALYVTWHDARGFCASQGKRLPTEAEWEKAARGPDGLLFPWGDASPDAERAMFGQHHVHEIPILSAVDSHAGGRSPYGLHHMAGNVAEWVHDWFGLDYYAYMPRENPAGPASGRYKGVRGGSWKSNIIMLRTATRSGFSPDQRSPTIGFRCAQSPLVIR